MKKPWGFSGYCLGISWLPGSRMAGQRWGHCGVGGIRYLFDVYTLESRLYELRHTGAPRPPEATRLRDRVAL